MRGIFINNEHWHHLQVNLQPMLAFQVNHDLELTPEYSSLHEALASNSANIISLLQMTNWKTSRTFLLTLASLTLAYSCYV